MAMTSKERRAKHKAKDPVHFNAVNYERMKRYLADETNRMKRNARRAVEYRITTGQMLKGMCRCGNEKAQAHHPDYSKPLEVIWLCTTHHLEAHGGSV